MHLEVLRSCSLYCFGVRPQVTEKKIYDDIPGTIVFDSDQATRGYHLNQFCISLRLAPNRQAFKADH